MTGVFGFRTPGPEGDPSWIQFPEGHEGNPGGRDRIPDGPDHDAPRDVSGDAKWSAGVDRGRDAGSSGRPADVDHGGGPRGSGRQDDASEYRGPEFESRPDSPPPTRWHSGFANTQGGRSDHSLFSNVDVSRIMSIVVSVIVVSVAISMVFRSVGLGNGWMGWIFVPIIAFIVFPAAVTIFRKVNRRRR